MLEIEVDGARQVKDRQPGRAADLRPAADARRAGAPAARRGDPDDKVAARLRKAEDEEPIGLTLADHVVVNDDLESTIDEMLAIIDARARATSASAMRGRDSARPVASPGCPGRTP